MEISLRCCRLYHVGVRQFSLCSSVGARQGFGGRDRKPDKFHKDAASILEDEQKGVFRVLDIGRPLGPSSKQGLEAGGGRRFKEPTPPPRHTVMKPDQDWGSVWPAPRTFHPAVVPLPVRQGVVQTKSQVVPSKYANTELMKIQNFLHLTPPVIQKHCTALRKFCTPWPAGLETEEAVNKHFPLEIITSDYLNSSSSIRDRRARIVTVRFKLSSLDLDNHAKDKFIRLVGERYDEESGTVTITADRCPYRGQNLDYIHYLLTALYHEAWTVEDWESKQPHDLEHFQVEEKAKGNNYARSLENILNHGENEASLRGYAEEARKLLNLPAKNVKAEIVI